MAVDVSDFFADFASIRRMIFLSMQSQINSLNNSASDIFGLVSMQLFLAERQTGI